LISISMISIKILKKRNIWDRIIETEQAVPKEQLKELLQGVVDSKVHLIPAITEKMAETPYDVMFIAGVGEVFPYIRSHNVLNNLQSTAKVQPSVMFFPGYWTTKNPLSITGSGFFELHRTLPDNLLG
jgi:hypothetical protein